LSYKRFEMEGINKGDITELKSFAKPPQLVADVMGITCMIVAGDNVTTTTTIEYFRMNGIVK